MSYTLHMLRLLTAFTVIIFASCTAQVETSHDAATELFPELRIIAQRGTGAVYAFYEDHVDRFHEQHLVFFSSPDDLFSRRTDGVLRSAYASGSALYPAYNNDFSHATGSRLSYGVFVPDTIVLISSTGARLFSIIHPTEQELLSLVQGKSLPSMLQ